MMRAERTHLLFLHLRNGQSIGPARLGQMWNTACGLTAGACVACRAEGEGSDNEVTYQLGANLDARLADAERTMHQMLDDGGFSFRLTRSR